MGIIGNVKEGKFEYAATKKRRKVWRAKTKS